MVFWGQIQNYMMRVNMSILVVAMAKNEPTSSKNGTTNITEQTCMENRMMADFNSTSSEENSNTEDNDDRFDWDAKTRGRILACFSIGYLTTQIIGGRMTEYYGVKRVYGFGLLMTGFLCFLSPVVARWNVWAFIVLRVFQGMFEGVTFPALHAMIARWVPLEERNSFMSRSFMGSVFGLVITFPLCGYMSAEYGWDSAFYTIGSITCAWFIFWWYLVFDSPEKHPRMDPKEKEDILNRLSKTLTSKPKPVPWRALLTSVPVWAFFISDMGNCWGIITLGSNGPTYLKYMLGLDLKTNGILSGLPMLSRYIGGIVCGAFADYLLRKKYLTNTWIRKIFNSICMFGPGIVMLIMAFQPESIKCLPEFSVTLFCIGMFLNGALTSGHFAAPADLAPNYSGTLMGISNTLSGGSISFIVPLIIGEITNDDRYGMSWQAWMIIFATASAIYIVSNIFYVFMISGDIQPWNYSHDDIKDPEEQLSILKNGASLARPEETNNI